MDKSKQPHTEYRVLGVMSGSSLDGLDVCDALISVKNGSWQYQLIHCWTEQLSSELKTQLTEAPDLTPKELENLDLQFGKWIAEILHRYIVETASKPDLVGIHGHTVFHLPEDGYSLQIGNGRALAKRLSIPVVDNFRNTDIRLGGQGAPLVPVGEHYLFQDFDVFINLGGIANISFHQNNILAWDVAPCNQVFNHFASLLGKPYDDQGRLTRMGQMDVSFYQKIRTFDYFQQPPPKSLANQWTSHIINLSPADPKNALFTYAHFLADELSKAIHQYAQAGSNVCITGGGAYHQFLIELLIEKCPEHKIVLPSKELIEYKEALVFGLLALLRYQNKVNVFASVTGASADSCSGDLHDFG